MKFSEYAFKFCENPSLKIQGKWYFKEGNDFQKKNHNEVSIWNFQCMNIYLFILPSSHFIY